MNERDYLKLKNKLDAEYKHKLDALNTVFMMAGGNLKTVGKSSPAQGKVEGGGQITRRGNLAKSIIKLLPELGSRHFTVGEVHSQLVTRNPGEEFKESSTSSALVRMAAEVDGPVETVTAGKGRRATVYRNRFSVAREAS